MVSKSATYFSHLLLLFALCGFLSCSQEEVATNDDAPVRGIVGRVEPIEFVPEVGMTRSSLSFGPSGLTFSWDKSDKLTIFPQEGSARAEYNLSKINSESGETGTSATFTGSGFTLTKDSRYYAISKTEGGAHSTWSFPSKENITVDFSGQRQTASGDYETAHLGEYDFMASTAIAIDNDQASFSFKHLGASLRMKLQNVPEGINFTALELYDSENTFRQPVRHVNLTEGLSDDSYVPALKEPDYDDASFAASPRFTLYLGKDNSTPSDLSDDPGISADASTHMIVCYMQIPPHNFTGKTMVFHLVSKDGQHDYYGTYSGINTKAGKAYQCTVQMEEASSYTVTLKLNHRWQLGTTKEVTRATGDPGLDEEMGLPSYIHYVWCVGGGVAKIGNITVSGNGKDKWTTSDDKVISTYGTPLTFNVDSEKKDADKHLYVVASNVDLSSCFSGITTSSTEDYVKALLYSIQTPTDQAASQIFLRDLYSTPWKSSTAFTGDVTDIYQDIVLYHTAAKVDLKWNNATAMTGNVSVNNVRSTNLSFFTPAANANTGTADYTVRSTLTVGTQYNGRQVYYLPQFNTYNVTVGSKISDITFTPGEGFTSWFRALIKQ